MKSKDLLSHLSDLETKLNSFSFEELTADEASTLKSSFQAFKSNLEDKVQGTHIPFSVTKNSDFHKKPENGLENLSKSSSKGKFDSTEGMLIANVSRAIRTPLSGIIGFTDLLKESALTKIQIDQVHAIRSASHTISEIIDEFLEYSKLSTRQERFESVDFNFYGTIRDVMYLCNTLIVDKNVRLGVDMDTDIPRILLGDPSKLSQILLHLLGNAIKFVEDGNINLKITKKKHKGEHMLLEFDITDTETGISEDSPTPIFDSLKLADTAYGGFDLGLGIIKQIIENLNGEIMFSNSLGMGANFKFTLPYQKGNDLGRPRKKKGDLSVGELKECVKGMRILVFEDNPTDQGRIGQLLKNWECRVYIADSSLYGLNILEYNKIDLVLMNLRMPFMNGFEVTQQIRHSKNMYVQQIPIIALTSDFTLKDRERCKTNGISDYILKPYSPEELLLKLAKNKQDMDTVYIGESTLVNPEDERVSKDAEVDLLPILEKCMGELDLLENLVSLYKQNALEFMGRARLHLSNKDIGELEFAVHKINSGLVMMQTLGLHKLALQMQHICQTDRDIRHLEFLYGCFLKEYPMVEKAIEKEMEKLRKKE